jgi:glutamate dehydrogenase (NAD(P)+)
MADEFATLKGHNEFGMITGKPLALGGSAGRGDATARGGMVVIREAAQALALDTDGATVAIQGFGNAGQFAALLSGELLGSKVVAISDSRGGIYNSEGLDPNEVLAHKRATGSVVDSPESEPISNAALLELDVDILIPAALEGVITEANAARIHAKIVAELANGPTTLEADDVLFENSVFVLPDFLCNAGGVIVSYYEMVQNAYGYYWDLETVHQRLDDRLTVAFGTVYKTMQEFQVDPRIGAYLVAVDRVAEAVRLRGWV